MVSAISCNANFVSNLLFLNTFITDFIFLLQKSISNVVFTLSHLKEIVKPDFLFNNPKAITFASEKQKRKDLV